MIACALVSCQRGKINIVLVNSKTTLLTNVKIVYTGGTLHTMRISPGEQQTFRIDPSGPSDLILTFKNADGSHYDKKVDTYFEGGYSGTITLTVMASGEVTPKDDLRTAQ